MQINFFSGYHIIDSQSVDNYYDIIKYGKYHLIGYKHNVLPFGVYITNYESKTI